MEPKNRLVSVIEQLSSEEFQIACPFCSRKVKFRMPNEGRAVMLHSFPACRFTSPMVGLSFTETIEVTFCEEQPPRPRVVQ